MSKNVVFRHLNLISAYKQHRIENPTLRNRYKTTKRMIRAIWRSIVIAESETTVELEGNHYFPPETIKSEFLKDSDHKTVCSVKGEASYKSVVIEGDTNENAAWYYPEPKEEASHIKNLIAFWNGVEIIDE